METNQTYQNELGSAMLPFVMRELVDTVMKRKTLPLEDALYYIYSSNLYKALLDENTKLWYSSTLSLYEALEKEKTEQKKVQKDNPKILLFQMFCAENYRETKNISAKETLLLFSNHGVFEFLYENFEMLHTQDTEYILDTIITYINKNKSVLCLFLFLVLLVFNCIGFSNVGFSNIGFSNVGLSNVGKACAGSSGVGSACGCS